MNVFDLFRPAPAGESRSPEVKTRAQWSVGDPALAEFLGIGSRTTSGQSVTSDSALGLTAVYRSVSIISGTIASLPWKSYRKVDGGKEPVTSFLDDPGAPVGLTPYAWKELMQVHLLMHGNWYGLHIYNGAGAIIGMQPLPPTSVSVRVEGGQKIFKVSMDGGQQREFTSLDLTHIMGMSLDGVVGLSPITVARNAIGAGLAGDEAAARMFSNGLLLGGFITTTSDTTKEQAETIVTDIKRRLSGAGNAGDIALFNRELAFNKWTMTSEDAQFIESRRHQIDEVARIFGVPKVLLAEDGASTWGSGIAELIRGMQRFTFLPITTRIEETLSMRLASPRFMEVDYAGLLQPTQSEVTDNLIKEIDAGLLTVDEARAILNRPALSTPTEVIE